MAFIDRSSGRHCGGCRRAAACGLGRRGPKGDRLVLAVLGVFLAPLLLALIGAAALAPWGIAAGAAGGLGGLILGVALAAGIYWLAWVWWSEMEEGP